MADKTDTVCDLECGNRWATMQQVCRHGRTIAEAAAELNAQPKPEPDTDDPVPLTLKQAIRQLQMLDQLADAKGLGEHIYFRLPNDRCLKAFELVSTGDGCNNFDIALTPMPEGR